MRDDFLIKATMLPEQVLRIRLRERNISSKHGVTMKVKSSERGIPTWSFYALLDRKTRT